MNPREHLLALGILLVVILAGIGFMINALLLGPLSDRNRSIDAVQKEIQTREDRLHQIAAERVKLDRWRAISLPPETELAQREYERYLTELMKDSGLTVGSFTISARPIDTKSGPTIAGKQPVYSKLTFTVHAQTNLANLVRALERFYRTPLLHQLKNLTIQRPLTTTAQQAPTDLTIDLTMEALIVTGVRPRSDLMSSNNRRLLDIDMAMPSSNRRLPAIVATTLQHGPSVLGLAMWTAGPMAALNLGNLADPPRSYEAIAQKNIFLGKVAAIRDRSDDVDASPYVHLTDITHGPKGSQALMYDRLNNRQYKKLRTEKFWDTFRIRDNKGETLFVGKVVRLEDRDLIFVVEEDNYILPVEEDIEGQQSPVKANRVGNYYSMHVGDNLQDAMKKPLSPERKKALGLGPAPAKAGEPKSVASSP